MEKCKNCGKEFEGTGLCTSCKKAEVEMNEIYERMSPEMREKHHARNSSEIIDLAEKTVRRWQKG